eukprot:5680973-Amphidinium_carterae.1
MRFGKDLPNGHLDHGLGRDWFFSMRQPTSRRQLAAILAQVRLADVGVLRRRAWSPASAI